MSDLPSVCIMIPTYNQARFVGKAIESALAQDYSNLTIVVADDHSTDNTSEVVLPFLVNEKIKYVKNTTNLGRVANYRNCLNRHTVSDWVINLDGDDYFTNTYFVKNAIAAICQQGASNVLFYQGSHCKASAQNHEPQGATTSEQQTILTGNEYLRSFFEINFFSHMSTLYNRVAALESDFYSMDVLSSDIYSFLRLVVQFPDKKIILTDENSGIWWQHDNNTSKSLGFNLHRNNFLLYTNIFRQMRHSKTVSPADALIWLVKAFVKYWGSWTKQKVSAFTLTDTKER